MTADRRDHRSDDSTRTALAELEARIETLETRLSFQDLTIEELNGVITAQQRRIDELGAELTRLVSSVAPAGVVSKDDDTKPPHY
jgi:SlyX protein